MKRISTSLWLYGFAFLLFLLSCNIKKAKPYLLYVKIFDGVEFVKTDTIKLTEIQPFSYTLREGIIYHMTHDSDTVIFYNSLENEIWLTSSTPDSLATLQDPVNIQLRNMQKLLLAIINEKTITGIKLDELNTTYEKQQLSFKDYQKLKDSLWNKSIEYSVNIKSSLENAMFNKELDHTILPAYLLFSQTGDTAIFNLEKEISLYQRIAGNYKSLSKPTKAQRTFITYVDMFDEYLREKQERDNRLQPGCKVEDLSLPNISQTYISLDKTCSINTFTLLMFVRNSCSLCNDERDYWKNRYIKGDGFEIYEVSVDETGSFKDWSDIIRNSHTQNWLQVMDTASEKNKVVTRFDVSITPSSYLLNCRS
ncbi:peroxiredoxin family protein [Chitinophaga sp. 30R24]|uniref:peroxiredoxin family protein n=1 Tax=Chitinophaga sp. 30R24 TaxID=3248838 RepID=UPI003B90B57E